MMTLQKIASELCKREGRKSQAKIHDVRELLRILVEWEANEFEPDDGGPIDALAIRAEEKWYRRKQRDLKKAAKAKK